VIAKHGKPVAKLIPVLSSSSQLMGALAGKLTISGDNLSTFLTG